MPVVAAEALNISTFLTQITGMLGDFTPANVLLVIGAALGLTIPLVLVWFAARWIIRKVSKALKGGSII